MDVRAHKDPRCAGLMRNQIRRITEEAKASLGGAWLLWMDSSRESLSGSAIEISAALSATSNFGMRLRTTLAAIPTSVRTTVWQHALDIFAELQSLAISSQQSISGF